MHAKNMLDATLHAKPGHIGGEDRIALKIKNRWLKTIQRDYLKVLSNIHIANHQQNVHSTSLPSEAILGISI